MAQKALEPYLNLGDAAAWDVTKSDSVGTRMDRTFKGSMGAVVDNRVREALGEREVWKFPWDEHRVATGW